MPLGALLGAHTYSINFVLVIPLKRLGVIGLIIYNGRRNRGFAQKSASVDNNSWITRSRVFWMDSSFKNLLASMRALNKVFVTGRGSAAIITL